MRGKSVELTDYLRVLRKRWLSIVVLTALALAGAAATLAATPAQTKLFVRASGASSNSDLQQGKTFVQQSVQSYAQVATQPVILAPVIAEMGLDTAPEELAQRVSAEAPLDTVMINVTASAPTPSRR